MAEAAQRGALAGMDIKDAFQVGNAQQAFQLLRGIGDLDLAAFLFHVVSAAVAFGATKGMATPAAFVYLWAGSFLFAVGKISKSEIISVLDPN